MDDDTDKRGVRTIGRPRVSGPGREVFSFHLHRYLSGWLRETGCDRVMVTVGFDNGDADLGAYRIGLDGGHSVRTGWDHRDLKDAWRFGDRRLVWEAPSGESIVFEVVAIYDDSADGDGEPRADELLGFATVRSDQGGEGFEEADLQRLARQTSEAICVARRNGVRLFFEEQKDRSVKELVYGMMDRLPEWAGCDHSAAVLLTHDLDAMTLEDSREGAFDVLAERIYFGDEEGEFDGDRTVGMSVETGTDAETILSDALEHYGGDGETACHVYRRDDAEAPWRRVSADEGRLSGWYRLADRPEAQTAVLVPLVHSDRGNRDLLGILSLSWSSNFGLPPSVRDVLTSVAKNLARLLRQSALYTLSVRKLWVGREVRDRVAEAIDETDGGPKVLESLIGSVSELVAEHVDVPSFALGYLRRDSSGRSLRYVHPHGWTRYEDLDLAVDVDPDERVDSGISALAARLGRPVVLAGGYGEGTEQEFKNHLWVDEEAGELFDARAAGRSIDDFPDHCRPLRDYYKPARESAYATLAYPMTFSRRQMGVLTVEVERQTDWLWWTGFGGHLFWDTIAREMALAIYALCDT